MPKTSDALSFWDSEVIAPRHSDWMARPEVREYLNTHIGGSEPLWPFDWLIRYLGGRRLPRALSVGCGTGALERDVIRRGISDRVDAFDGSLTSLQIARQEAEREGMADSIHYFAYDFNEPVLPRGVYDAVFFHHSLHHVAKLEKLLRAVLHALKPGGLLYLDEYVGPSRDWWSDSRFAPKRSIFDALVPKDVRFVPALPFPVVADDPSEAIRSGEILEQLSVGFDVVEKRGYGGNLLAVVYAAIDWAKAPGGLLERLIAEETALLNRGEPPFLMIVVAMPKQGMGKRLASLHYFAAPKLKRIGRELRKIVRG